MNVFPQQFLNIKYELKEDFELSAAMFFKEYKKDAKTALEFLSSQDSLKELIVRSELYILLGDYKKAEDDLKILLNQNDDPTFKITAMPLMGKMYYELNRYSESIEWFNKYFSAQPNDTHYRHEYAKTLAEIKRWDLSIGQYKCILKQRDLTNEENLLYIMSLTNNESFDDSKERIRKLFSNITNYSTVEQIKTAQLAYTIKRR